MWRKCYYEKKKKKKYQQHPKKEKMKSVTTFNLKILNSVYDNNFITHVLKIAKRRWF